MDIGRALTVACVLQLCVPQQLRCLHTGCARLAVDKSLLMKLRKNTGYTFINCKAALEKFNNDITQVIFSHRDSGRCVSVSSTKNFTYNHIFRYMVYCNRP